MGTEAETHKRGAGEATHKEIKVTRVKNFTNSKFQTTVSIGREPPWVRFILFT